MNCACQLPTSVRLLQAPRRYLSYLPQDNSGLADPQSEQVVQTISNDLAELLSSPIAEFWHSVATADSLIACLDSYLRFARSACSGLASQTHTHWQTIHQAILACL